MRRKSEEEKRFTGTLRPSKAKKPIVLPIHDGLRRPPDRLGPEAAHLWLSEALPLVEAEILTICDVCMFCDLLELIVDYRRVRAEIGGQYIQIGDEGQIIRHPAWSICRDMLGLINGMRRDFGLSPLSREKLSAKPKNQEEENPFAKFG
ncbi:MAG: P27 family phage terminase small subunit [Chlorobiaceae bacterium]|jgi:P27 family predicted phage terminase small subunit